MGVSDTTLSQDFYKDYRNYLKNVKHNDVAPKRKGVIDTAMKRLRLTIGRNEKERKKSFFTTDTIFMVGFQAAETGFLSEIIWNRKTSCYFHHSYQTTHSKIVNRKLEIESNGSDMLKSFNYDFRHAIETVDTSGYNKYADSHSVFDGEWLSPIVAIKTNNHWKFISFKGNGWAINYDFEPTN